MANNNASYSSQSNPGMMLPTTSVWDVSQIYQVEDIPDDLKNLLVVLYQNLNNMALAVNLKNNGYYPLQEFLTGQAYFPNPNNTSTTSGAAVYRQVFRMTVNFGALPNATTKKIPHNIQINSSYSITSISGAATQTTPFAGIPIPYASSTTANIIECSIDNQYVYITTGIDYSAYTLCYITIEYIKS